MVPRTGAAERLPLQFEILGQRVAVACSDPGARALLLDNFGPMARSRGAAPVRLRYSIAARPRASYVVSRHRGPKHTGDLEDVLFFLEQDITVELQKARPDLLFLHAATLERRGCAVVIAGESGTGKSTTTWGLLHRGFGYLSDELSPVDMDTLSVHPYAHALCLKGPPPCYPLPDRAIRLRRTVHVAAADLPAPTLAQARRIQALFLLDRRTARAAGTVRRLTTGEAVARLYVTVLNALAHSARGIDAVLRIASSVPCYAIAAGALETTCAVIGTTVDRHIPAAARSKRAKPRDGRM